MLKELQNASGLQSIVHQIAKSILEFHLVFSRLFKLLCKVPGKSEGMGLQVVNFKG